MKAMTWRMIIGSWLILVVILTFGLYALSAVAQDGTVAAKEKAFLIVCDSDPGRIIVLDGTGRWMPDVKSAALSITVGKPASVRCEIYAGLIKPSTPTFTEWELAQIQSMSSSEFQQTIDSLQRDPMFVQKSCEEMKKPITPPANPPANP